MSIIVIEIDLAKTICAVHGVNEDGTAELVNYFIAQRAVGSRVMRLHRFSATSHKRSLPTW